MRKLSVCSILIKTREWIVEQVLVMDYSEAGRNVLADLVTKYGGQWWEHGTNVMDSVHQHSTGACIYVGGWQAAEDLALLRSKNITHVVNCTTDLTCPHTSDITYLTFDISWWRRYIADDIKNLPNFIGPMLQFIEESLVRGESVLVHCLMGAHRAGSTAVICCMHFEG